MKFFTCCPPFPGKHHLALMVSLVPCFGIQPQPSPPPSPNCLIDLGQVPADWKLSNITPVPKGGDPKLVSNYRPILLLSLPSKILERIIYNRLLSHLLTNSLLSNSQFGFCPCSSTQEALIAATTSWHQYLDEKQSVAAESFWSLKSFWFSSPPRYPQSSYSSWCHRLIAHLVCWLSIWSHAACCP